MDVNYVDVNLANLFIIAFLLTNGRVTSRMVIEYAGHFKLTQNRSIIESIINILVSLASVHYFGIYGVLFGTIAALLYRTNDMVIYASKHLLKRKASVTYIKWLSNAGLFVVVTILMREIIQRINMGSYVVIIGSAVIACTCIIPLFFVVASVIDRNSYRFCLTFCKEKLKHIIEKHNNGAKNGSDE